MEPLKELLDLFTESRMQYGHLTIIFIYGLIAAFLIGPFVCLVFFPHTTTVDIAAIGPFYWQQFLSLNFTGLVMYLIVAFNAGMLLSSVQLLSKELYWRWIVKPAARLFGKRKDCSIIEDKLVSSSKFENKAEYVHFLEWLEPQKHRRRVRSWDWFMSNAFRTFDFVVFLYLTLNTLLIIAVSTLGLAGANNIPLYASERSWALVIVTLVVFVSLIPGDIHHYRVRAEGDAHLYEEFQKHKAATVGTKPKGD